MGCCTSRNSLSIEDKIISYNERKIGLSCCSPSNIEFYIKKWIGSEGLTLPRLKKAAECLKIDIGDFKSPEDPLAVLFKEFQVKDSFNVSDLITFCVFLCSARPNEKSEIWFNIIDSSLITEITYGQTKQFLELLYKFTFKILPLLAKGDGELGLSDEKIEIYVNEAFKCQKRFLETYAMKICPEHTLDKETFIAQMSLYSKITYSEGFRQLVRDYLKAGYT
jgi:hypothetical protein